MTPFWLVLALTPDAMTPSQQLALALRQQAVPEWEMCQVDFDQWQGQVMLELAVTAGAVDEASVMANSTDDPRFGKCLVRKLKLVTLPASFTGGIQLHLNLVDRALDARVNGGHWEHWSVDGGPAVEWAEYAWRPDEGRFWGRGDWISFHENMQRVDSDLDACWLEQQAFDPYVAGRVELLVRVRGGRARSVEVVTNTSGAQELGVCFTEIFEGALFPPDLDGLVLYPVIRKPPPGLELRLAQWDSLLGYLGYHCRGPYRDQSPAHRVDSRLAFTVRKGVVQKVDPQAGSETDLACIQERLPRFAFETDTSGHFVVTVPLLYDGEQPADPHIPEPLGRTVAAVYGKLAVCADAGRPDGRMDLVITLAAGKDPHIEVLQNGTGVTTLGPCFVDVLEDAPWPAIEGRWRYPFFFDYEQ